ncbi:MAG: tRNA pseudouridine(55) synthase TruB [Bacteroidales bacterium]
MLSPVKTIDQNTDFKAGQLLLVDKPKGITSFKVVKDIRYWIKKSYQIKEKLKVGHAGTLDPLASGLLMICTGKLTKQIDELQGAPKTYQGTFTFGATTPSFDLETETDHTYPSDHLNHTVIQQAFDAFLGKILQEPPVYSAVKVDGRRAYDYARKKDKIQMKKKVVEIFQFDLLSYENSQARFQVHCSKGTYIRALARDVGFFLQSGAYLSDLRRTQVGNYTVEQALKPETIKEKISSSGFQFH